MLPFPCILACFAGHFLYIFAVFAGEACKNSKNIHFVSAAGAKSADKEKALHNDQQRLYFARIYVIVPIWNTCMTVMAYI
jgi:hypothetical protein